MADDRLVRPSPVARVLMRLHDTLIAARPGLADGSDPDYGHATRVAIRRARAALRAMGRRFGGESTRILQRDLHWLAGLVGPRRDLVVAAEQLARLLPPEVWARLSPLFDARQQQALIAVRHGLALPRLRRLHDGLTTAIEAAGAISDDAQEQQAARRARKLLRDSLRAARAIGTAGPPTPIHELRKQLKKLRYTLELLRSHQDEPWLRPCLSALKTLQDWLGHYQDLTVRADLLERLASDQLARASPASVAALHQWYDDAIAERDRMTATFPAAFAPFAAVVATQRLLHHLRTIERG